MSILHLVAATETTMPPKIATKAVPRSYCAGENFVLWLNHFNRIAAANAWDEQARMAYLETKLTGRAQSEFEVFIEEEPDITFAEITEKLSEELVPSPQKALEMFTEMRLEGKSPKEFYGCLVRQSKLAHGEMRDAARHIIVRTQMLQVLPKKLKTNAAHQGYLADMGKEQFLELLTRVYDAEMRDEVWQPGEPGYEPMVSQVNVSSVESQLKKLEEKDVKHDRDMGELMSMVRGIYTGTQQKSWGGRRPQSLGASNAAQNMKCFRCLEEGHFARDCRNAVRCTKCNEEGHMRSTCQKN